MSRVLPILFNTEMVRAILDGRKTVTRRLIKFPVNAKSHYQPGDILYVRETWTNDKLIFGDGVVSAYRYKTDGEEFLNANGECIDILWHPSTCQRKLPVSG